MNESDFENFIKKYPKCLINEKNFKALFSDIFPEEIKIRNLLSYLFSIGLKDDIDNSHELDNMILNKYVKCLMDSFGTNQKIAEEAVKIWIIGYGKNILNHKVILQNDINVYNEYEKDDLIPNEQIDTLKLRDGTKLDKKIIQRCRKAEKVFEISDLKMAVHFYKGYSDLNYLEITGEVVSSQLPCDIVVFAMVYNADNYMIGCSFEERLNEDDWNGIGSISFNVWIPKGEIISRVYIRPVRRPGDGNFDKYRKPEYRRNIPSID